MGKMWKNIIWGFYRPGVDDGKFYFPYTLCGWTCPRRISYVTVDRNYRKSWHIEGVNEYHSMVTYLWIIIYIFFILTIFEKQNKKVMWTNFMWLFVTVIDSRLHHRYCDLNSPSNSTINDVLQVDIVQDDGTNELIQDLFNDKNYCNMFWPL